MTTLAEKFETWVADGRKWVADHETGFDRDAEDVRRLVSSPVGEAVSAAIHVPEAFLISVINGAEKAFADAAGTPPAEPDVPTLPESGPVIAGQAR